MNRLLRLAPLLGSFVFALSMAAAAVPALAAPPPLLCPLALDAFRGHRQPQRGRGYGVADL